MIIHVLKVMKRPDEKSEDKNEGEDEEEEEEEGI